MQFSLSRLPQELFNSVVDLLRADPHTLKSLGLVSTSWYWQTRVYLFHEIALSREARCQDLHHILAGRPELCKLVVQLRITDSRSWLYACPEIAEILSFLTSLTKVTLHSMNWALYPVGLQIELDNLLARHTLTELSMYRVDNVDLVPLAQHRNLEHLTMESVRPWPTSSASTGACFPLNRSASLGSSPKLSVTLGQCGEALKTLLLCAADSEATLPLLRCSTITLLTGHFEQDMREAWTALLDHCAPSLMGYSFQQKGPMLQPFIPAMLPLSCFRRLGFVILALTHTQEHQTLSHLFDELEGIRSSGTPSTILLIGFVFDFPGPKDRLCRAIMDVANDPRWEELDRLLIDSSFASIFKIRFAFNVEEEFMEDDLGFQMARDSILRRLQHLGSKGVVEVRLGATIYD